MRTVSALSINTKATGRIIATVRESAGLSVADLQQILGFEAPQAIYKWQRGESLPKLDHLVIVAEVCQVPLDDLIVLSINSKTKGTEE